MKIFLMAVALWLLLLLVLLGVAYLSGRTPRAYPVLPPDTQVTIQGVTRPVSEWAAAYIPKMMVRTENPTLPLLWIFYEAMDDPQGDLALVYYLVWEDEIHPNLLYHNVYKLFRAAFYGYPLRDIEYLQIKVDRDSGAVSEAMFETSPGSDYFVAISKHIVARFTRQPDGRYALRLTERNGQLITEQATAPVCVEGTRLVAGVATWNHLTRLAGCDANEVEMKPGAPLRVLTDSDYREFKFARKSQGDFRTRENSVGLIAGGAAFLLMMSPVLLASAISKRFRKGVN